jgi:hypothetical protein
MLYRLWPPQILSYVLILIILAQSSSPKATKDNKVDSGQVSEPGKELESGLGELPLADASFWNDLVSGYMMIFINRLLVSDDDIHKTEHSFLKNFRKFIKKK